jgi:hypothetical protein
MTDWPGVVMALHDYGPRSLFICLAFESRKWLFKGHIKAPLLERLSRGLQSPDPKEWLVNWNFSKTGDSERNQHWKILTVIMKEVLLSRAL